MTTEQTTTERLAEALREIIAECPEPKLPYGRKVVEIARDALAAHEAQPSQTLCESGLLGCPFCGSDADYEPHDHAKHGGHGIVYGVICNLCGASSARNYTSREFAQRRWNARTNVKAAHETTPSLEREALGALKNLADVVESAQWGKRWPGRPHRQMDAARAVLAKAGRGG